MKRMYSAVLGAGFVSFLFLAGPCFGQQKLFLENGGSDDYFGESISISGNQAVIGAKFYGNGGTAHVYFFDEESWVKGAELVPEDSPRDARFGRSVSISGGTVAVGASCYHAEGARDTGSVYVFEKIDAQWVQVQQILPVEPVDGDYFGRDVALSGDDLVVSRDGSIIVYERNDGSFDQVAQFTDDDPSIAGYYVRSLDICSDRFVVGGFGKDENGSVSVVKVYRKGADGWALDSDLEFGDMPAPSIFGGSVSISGDLVAAGGRRDLENGSSAGAVYIFANEGGA